MKNASLPKVKEMIRNSSRYHVNKMNASLQNAIDATDEKKVSPDMIEKIRTSNKLAAVSVGNYHDLQDHGDTYGLKIDVINIIWKWMDDNIKSWGFMDVMAASNSAEEQMAASAEGHGYARGMRSVYAPHTNKTASQNITVNPAMVGLAKEFWNIVKKATGPVTPIDKNDKKYTSFVTELQDHIAIFGNLNQAPPICWAVGKDGHFLMSKFLAAKEKWISPAHLKQLKKAMEEEDSDTFKKIKEDVDDVDIKEDEGGNSSIFKKNAMTMDYGCLFWFTLKVAGLTSNEAALIMMSTNEMAISCDSDKKCMKWLRMKANGGGKMKTEAGIARPVDAFEKIVNLMDKLIAEKRVKQVKDNPWALTQKTLIEGLVVAGTFPIVYRANRLIGRHDLFIVKNLLCENYSQNTVDMVKEHFRKNPITEGHVIHRGLVGSVFSNIFEMDTSKLNFIGGANV